MPRSTPPAVPPSPRLSPRLSPATYQRTKDMERLSFLYLITGNTEKLRKMLKIAEMRADVMGRFHNALYLGEVPERIKLLVEAGQLPLAYVTAATHGFTEQAEALGAQLEAAGLPLPTSPAAEPKLLYPALPITREANWPLLTISKGTFERGLGGAADGAGPADGLGDGLDLGDDGLGGGDGWGDDLDAALGGGGDGLGGGGGGGLGDEDPFGDGEGTGAEAAADGEGWGDDLDLGDVALPSGGGGGGAAGYYVAPTVGQPLTQKWSRDSNLIADHAAAGSFETAMQMLVRQHGIVSFAPLRPLFLAVAGASHAALTGMPSTPPLLSPLQRGAGFPRLCLSLGALVEKLKVAYGYVASNKLQEALDMFQYILAAILVTTVDQRSQMNDLKGLVTVCKEYVTGLRLELLRRNTTDATRAAELAAYTTHCNMQPAHLLLFLKQAMTVAYKANLKIIASSFARRMLELNPKPDWSTQARKVMQLCDQSPTNAFEVNYDERNPFVVCGESMVPIYRGSAVLQCSYCKAAYLPEHKGKLCNVCKLGSVGGDAGGFGDCSLLSEGGEMLDRPGGR